MAARLGSGRSRPAFLPQERGPFRNSAFELGGLRPLSQYCLQVQAHLLWESQGLARPGLSSNVSCHETAADGKMCLLAPFLSWESSETGEHGLGEGRL